MSENWATIPDWHEKQHYKTGRGAPPWIKLHANLLSSRRFQTLPIASKALAPQLWLLATKNDGRVNVDLEELEFQLRWPRKEIEAGLKPLIDNGYLVFASDVLASYKQAAIPETETETETETELSSLRSDNSARVRERNAITSANTSKPKRTPRDALREVLDFERAEAVIEHRKALRKPLTTRAADLLARQFALARDGPNAAADRMIASGWIGFKAEWENGNASRNDRNGSRAFSGVVANLRDMLVQPPNGDRTGPEPVPDHELEAVGRGSSAARNPTIA